ERRSRLEAIARSTATTVLYESPRRLVATLGDLAEACGSDRRAAVSRELTKRFETTYRGTLASLHEELAGQDLRGEVVVVVAPAPGAPEGPDYHALAQALAREGVRGGGLRRALEAV